MKKEITIPNFEDVAFEDFERFEGRLEIVYAIRKSYEKSLDSAKKKLVKTLDDFNVRCDARRFEEFRELYHKFAEVDFMQRTCENNVGKLILCGFAVSEIVSDVKELARKIEDEIEKEAELEDWPEEEENE